MSEYSVRECKTANAIAFRETQSNDGLHCSIIIKSTGELAWITAEEFKSEYSRLLYEQHCLTIEGSNKEYQFTNLFELARFLCDYRQSQDALLEEYREKKFEQEMEA